MISNSEMFYLIIITVLIAIILLMIIHYYAFGIKYKIEGINLNKTIKAAYLGANTMNHAIRNEIMLISLYVNNILYNIDKDENKIKSGANGIISSVNHMNDIVSRMQGNISNFDLIKTMNNLGEITDECLENLSFHINEKNIKIIKNYDDDSNFVFDKLHVKEVIINVLKNAIEAIENNGEIDIDIMRFKRHITFTIKDNGVGIKTDDLSHVIEPFFSTKHNCVNFGLGLAYCYGVMKKHRGSLKITSSENVGTSVKLEFPLKVSGGQGC